MSGHERVGLPKSVANTYAGAKSRKPGRAAGAKKFWRSRPSTHFHTNSRTSHYHLASQVSVSSANPAWRARSIPPHRITTGAIMGPPRAIHAQANLKGQVGAIGLGMVGWPHLQGLWARAGRARPGPASIALPLMCVVPVAPLAQLLARVGRVVRRRFVRPRQARPHAPGWRGRSEVQSVGGPLLS